MKLYSLSAHPNKPCYIFHFKDVTLMLDCGLDSSSALHYLPLPLVPSRKLSSLPNWTPKEINDAQLEGEFKENPISGRLFLDSQLAFAAPQDGVIDYSTIDAILISNYTCMLALPFITEETGFKGRIYATEPTLQIGRLYMEELVHYIQRIPKPRRAARWKKYWQSLPPPFCDILRPHTWRALYDMKTVNAALSKVQMVGFNEKIDVFGALQLTPVSSGYCLGSCNWLINSGYQKIAYVSGTSTLTTHPRPMDQSALRHSDLLILTGLTQTPTANPDSMLGEFCMAVALTLRGGGNVLVPCYASGVVYDLFECLSSHLDSSNLSQIPLFFVSPVAESSLAYSNIFAEWLSSGKQNKVYLPEEPFPHAQLVRNNRLKHFKYLHEENFTNEYRQPCVLFCGHPSLRYGDVVHFLELWGGNASNTIVFTEPEFPYLEALSPYQPLAMKAVHCPIDTSLNFSQANKLIRDLKPQTLLVPEQYLSPPLSAPLRNDLVIETEVSCLPLKPYDIISLPLKRKQEKLFLHPALASQLQPTPIKPGLAATTVTGRLASQDNRHTLHVYEGSEGKDKLDRFPHRSEQKYPWGPLDVTQLVQKLNYNGLTDAKVEEGPEGVLVHLPREDTLIQMDASSTHIFCQDDALRRRLKDILLQCLPAL